MYHKNGENEMKYEDIARVNSEIEMIDMKGKNYAMVPERVTAFRKLYPEGFIDTEIIANDGKTVLMQAKIGYFREDGSPVVLGTGFAQETMGRGMVNNTSHIENCVPLDTEILTDSGWKYYYQVNSNDFALSLNILRLSTHARCSPSRRGTRPARTVPWDA